MDGIIELTEKIFTVQREVCGYLLQVSVKKLGQDLLVSVEGGQKPHVGCVIQSVPRTSLTGDGSFSATSRNGMRILNNRRVRRSIILPGIAKYRTDILRQCLVKCVSEF